jgi:nicotinamide-nucleotide amidase
MGVRVLFHSTVGDELHPSADVFRAAIDRADLIVATGGLGPTADDLTREALALAADRPLQLDAEALEEIRRMFARFQRPMPQQNELQAMFPEGSRVVHNPHGTAPGIDLEVPRPGRTACRVICLPGVPAEMIEMWNDSVAESILKTLEGRRRVILRRRIHCFGAGESQVESMLPDLIRRGRQPTVGITASKATISLRIVAEGATEEECRAAIGPVEAVIRSCLGSLVFGEEDDELQHAVVRRLRDSGKTLATADAASAGLLAEWLGSVENASDVYRGGLLLMETSDSAESLAARCREQFQADFGLALGPARLSPSSGNGAGGEGSQTVAVAICSSAGIETKIVPFAYHPALRNIFFAKHALNFLRLQMQNIS